MRADAADQLFCTISLRATHKTMKQIIVSALCLLPIVAGAQLTGIKTIGGANPDYPTLTAAIGDLTNQGAVGNLVFNIRPGTYTGRYALGTIAGNYGSITFKSENNVADSVVLESDASTAMNNYIFKLDGTDSIVFDHLSFRPLDTVYARSIYFVNECLALTITHCLFQGSTYPESFEGYYRAIVQCDQDNFGPANPQDVTITDNVFRNGYSALDLKFDDFGGARSYGLNVSGNIFEDQYSCGMEVWCAVGQITDNRIMTSKGYYYIGIDTRHFDGGSQVLRNRIDARATTGSCFGIEYGDTQSTTGNMISNNMVHCISMSEAAGIALEDVWGVSVVHNSVLIGAGSAVTSAAFHHRGTQSAGQDAVVHNNLFANHAAGVAYQVDVPANVAAEDHNGLFTNGPKISMIAGNLIPDLSTHQSVTGMGANDTDMDPVFPLQPDLHMNTCSSGFAGAYFNGVDSDLDGDARGNPVCDMGADEHSFSDTIQAPDIVLSSDSLPFTLSVGASFSQYDWSTGASTPTIQINAGGTYSCTVVDANGCTYTMNVLVVVDPGTGVFTSATSSVALFPVPVSNAMTIQGLAPGVRYEVLDAAGRVVLRGSGNGTSTTMDATALRHGLHLLRWLAEGALYVLRFIKD